MAKKSSSGGVKPGQEGQAMSLSQAKSIAAGGKRGTAKPAGGKKAGGKKGFMGGK